MEYAVPLGILVAVLAWGVGTWVRLQRLLRAAEEAWRSWGDGTRSRNESLIDFTLRYSGFLPRGMCGRGACAALQMTLSVCWR